MGRSLASQTGAQVTLGVRHRSMLGAALHVVGGGPASLVSTHPKPVGPVAPLRPPACVQMSWMSPGNTRPLAESREFSEGQGLPPGRA